METQGIIPASSAAQKKLIEEKKALPVKQPAVIEKKHIAVVEKKHIAVEKKPNVVEKRPLTAQKKGQLPSQPNKTDDLQKEVPRGEKTIKVTIKKSFEIEDKMKELSEKIKACQGHKIRLILKTFIEDDPSMIKFSTSFFKSAGQAISYLEWEISGTFTDPGQSKAVGDVIGRIGNLYSLNLYLNGTFFADKGAVALAAGLNKLKRLHILKLKLESNNERICNKITEKGLNVILKAVSEMPELEICKHNLSDCQLVQYPPKLATMSYYLSEFSDERVFDPFRDDFENKPRQALTMESAFQHQQNIITKITLNNDYYVESEFERKGLVNCVTLMQYCFSNLPYLTKLKLKYFESVQKIMPHIFKQFQIIEGLTSDRFNMILHILALKAVSMSEFLPINPQLVLVDLMFD